MTDETWTPPTPPKLRRESAGRYWVGEYEIVNTGSRRWTVSRIDPDHVRTFGGGRDDGSSIIESLPTLAEAADTARDCWINDRHPETIAALERILAPSKTSVRLAPPRTDP